MDVTQGQIGSRLSTHLKLELTVILIRDDIIATVHITLEVCGYVCSTVICHCNLQYAES